MGPPRGPAASRLFPPFLPRLATLPGPPPRPRAGAAGCRVVGAPGTQAAAGKGGATRPQAAPGPASGLTPAPILEEPGRFPPVFVVYVHSRLCYSLGGACGAVLGFLLFLKKKKKYVCVIEPATRACAPARHASATSWLASRCPSPEHRGVRVFHVFGHFCPRRPGSLHS